MVGCRYTLSGNGTTIDLGTVSSISDVISVTNSKTEIATLTAEEAFVMDTGGTESITVSSTRKSPDSPSDGSSDSTKWSNAYWVQKLQSLVNHWQAEHDGYVFKVTPSVDVNDEHDAFSVNCYIGSLRVSYEKSTPELVSIQLELKVGSFYGKKNTSTPTVADDDMTVMISDSKGTTYYYLMNNKRSLNCIKSYSISGGINQPFEYIEMKIPRRRLESYASALVTDNDIIAGKNKITVKAVGLGNFVVTRCKLSNDIYSITGYAYAEAFKGAVTAHYDQSITPSAIMKDILTNGVSIQGSYVMYDGDSLVIDIDSANDVWNGSVDIPADSNAWYVLQLCALRLGAKVFFAENKAYIIDTSLESATQDQGSIAIDTDDTDYVGSPELGDEGTSTVCNVVTVVYNDGNDSVSVSYGNGTASEDSSGTEGSEGDDDAGTDTGEEGDDGTATEAEGSNAYYGDKGSKTIRIPEVLSEADAKAMAMNYMKYVADSQTSIGFTVKEMSSKGWHRRHPVDSRASMITDEFDNITVNNVSNSTGQIKLQLLTQSTFERSYPDGTSEYWFGVQKANDLTQTVSQILTALNN